MRNLTALLLMAAAFGVPPTPPTPTPPTPPTPPPTPPPPAKASADELVIERDQVAGRG